MSHTPGPWIIKRPFKGKYRGDFSVHPESGPSFAYLAQGREDIQSANARLIAAAPDLLEAANKALPLLVIQRGIIFDSNSVPTDFGESVIPDDEQDAIHDVIALDSAIAVIRTAIAKASGGAR